MKHPHSLILSILVLSALACTQSSDSLQQSSRLTSKTKVENKNAKPEKKKKAKPKRKHPELDKKNFNLKYHSPEESIKAMELPEGYSLELVASEPMVQEPVIVVWDGDGKMYVAEMNTYMQDADYTGQDVPKSRVLLLEDTDGDGKMDKRTVFADNLMIPRIVLPLDGRVIIGETHTLDLYAYEDTDGDGKSDKKVKIYEGGRRGGNMEHQPSGLIWNLDNYLYTTYNGYRQRYKDGKIFKEKIAGGGGQWGLTHDDYGKVWNVNAGGERGPVNYQQPIHYGGINLRGQEKGQWKIVWPIDNVPDVQGGLRRVREDGSLNHFTATCGQAIFRGDRLPKDIRGQLFFCEPVGRLIRRTQIDDSSGKTILSNPYEKDKNEFMRTKDIYFRPVNMATGPDGCLYIVDMYRGIIQQGNWTRPGSYLRSVIDQLDIAKHINGGRIYRLVHKDFKRDTTKPQLLKKSAKDLLPYLSHPNGWWRSTTQKLLVLKKDKSVIPALKKLVFSAKTSLGRIHALWTLEGLDVIDKELIKKAIKEGDDNLKVQAMRVSESAILKGGNDDYFDIFAAVKNHKNPKVLNQYALTIRRCLKKDPEEVLTALREKHKEKSGVNETISALLRSFGDARRRKAQAEAQKNNRKIFEAGRKHYESLCIACHAKDGKGTKNGKLVLGPAFAKSPIMTLRNPDSLIRIVLNGLKGTLRGKKYDGLMVPMKSYDDKYIAEVLSFIRNSFGNKGSYLAPEQVAKIRKETENHAEFTEAELMKLDKDYRKAVKKMTKKK